MVQALVPANDYNQSKHKLSEPVYIKCVWLESYSEVEKQNGVSCLGPARLLLPLTGISTRCNE